jgi:hypothetical protein
MKDVESTEFSFKGYRFADTVRFMGQLNVAEET